MGRLAGWWAGRLAGWMGVLAGMGVGVLDSTWKGWRFGQGSGWGFGLAVKDGTSGGEDGLASELVMETGTRGGRARS